MRAIDTNVLVRFLMEDDPAQAKAARAAIMSGDVYVPLTVLLESEWVLRTGYRLTSQRIAASLRAVAGMPGVTIEQPDRLIEALDAMARGLDFADALHLAGAGGCSAFLTFDRKLARRASGISSIPVEEP